MDYGSVCGGHGVSLPGGPEMYQAVANGKRAHDEVDVCSIDWRLCRFQRLVLAVEALFFFVLVASPSHPLPAKH